MNGEPVTSSRRRRPALAALVALALLTAAQAGEAVRGGTMVELAAPRGQVRASLPDALRQVSRQTGLTLVIRDTPAMRTAAVDAGRRELSSTLRRIGYAAHCDVHRQGRVVGFSSRLRTDRNSDWDRFFLEWRTFARTFRQFDRPTLRIFAALTPDQRWQVLGEGKELSATALSSAQRRVAARALADRYGGGWPDALPDRAVITARWQVYVELRGPFGNYSVFLRKGLVERRPDDECVRDRLATLLAICDDVIHHPFARLASERMAAALRAADAAELSALTASSPSRPSAAPRMSLALSTGAYTLAEIVQAVAEQTGVETHADRDLVDRKVFLAAGPRPVELAALQTGVAWAADAFWRSIGPVDILCPQSFFVEGWRRLRGLWELRGPSHRRFDAQFIALTRLWMPRFLSFFPDSHLYAGLIPYRLSPQRAPRWRKVISRLKGETGKPIPAELLRETKTSRSAAVLVQPELVFMVEGVRDKPVDIGCRAFQDDTDERDRLFGNA